MKKGTNKKLKKEMMSYKSKISNMKVNVILSMHKKKDFKILEIKNSVNVYNLFEKKIENSKMIKKRKEQPMKKNFSNLILSEPKKKNRIKVKLKLKSNQHKNKQKTKLRYIKRFLRKKMIIRKKLLRIGKSKFMIIIRNGNKKDR